MVDKEISPINDTTYEVELAGGDKVEIGDRGAVDFKPSLRLNRWSGECFIKVSLPTAEKIIPVVEVGKVKWRGQKMEACFYPLEPRTVISKDKKGKDISSPQNELGGFEFEIILREKPVTNQIILDIQTQDLRFSYQPELTEKEKAEGAIRPDNVVGSYAVYHATKKNNQYMTGKAFHIYRPQAEDALGNKAWCSLQIDEHTNPKNLTITIPQGFLDEATYPVTVDPDFGYTSIGGTMADVAGDSAGYWEKRAGSAWPMPAPGGTANYIEAYMTFDWKDDVKAFINQKDSVAAGQHGQIATAEVLDATNGWVQFTLAGETLISGVVYILNILADSTNIASGGYNKLRFDNNEAVASYLEDQDYGAPESPWVVNPEGTTRDYSIYCNYTEAVVGLENKSANMAAKMVAAGLL